MHGLLNLIQQFYENSGYRIHLNKQVVRILITME